MRFELGHVPMPDGYGEAILSLDDCKAHLRVTNGSEDALISALRDAAIEFVERWCGVKLGPVTGLTWSAESFPADQLDLAVRPVTDVTGITYLDGDGAEVTEDVADYRFTASGLLRPGIGKSWPTGVGGAVEVTFDAGFASPPSALVQAVRMMLAHLFMNREAVVSTGMAGEAPLGVTSLCSSFRQVSI
ncbi:head-tail connector protein [Qipengyuania sp. 6B39]|uniref:head-tail connector protein n=1 Tax=Qipengyuania proteolytica TaxID=2867239 RepID=UPI001C8AB66E|nr:head-tail connector protein [Qipengyuania proteolytica]MBX7496767.1 head-tail connector protein [Qipengyuania proteolytica]